MTAAAPASTTSPTKNTPTIGKASSFNARVLHQSSDLEFSYGLGNGEENSTEWTYAGRTTLWLILQRNNQQNTLNSQDFALHFRGEVTDVSVCTASSRCRTTKLNCSYVHLDPLAKVFTSNDPNRIDADAHCCRDGDGQFDCALRSSAVASVTGELRVNCDISSLHPSLNSSNNPNKKKNNSAGNTSIGAVEDFAQFWKDDISHDVYNADSSMNNSGIAFNREQKELLNMELEHRSVRKGNDSSRRERRIDLISQKLGNASLDYYLSLSEQGNSTSAGNNNLSSKPPLVLRVTIHFRLPVYAMSSPLTKGISFNIPIENKPNTSPYVYTISGECGDHEGTRMWLPCLDSTSARHRTSHELSVCVAAPASEGISVVGCGEDAGATNSIFSAPNSSRDVSTTMWLSNIWSPMPSRCLGFAIGPFKVINDYEYFEDEGSNNNVAIGEGIRQVYIASMDERQFLHSAQSLESEKLQRDIELAIIGGTGGIPLRALNFAKEFVGLPYHQSSSYTQVWLPNAIDGGASSGTLQQCGIATNCWLGGAILDASLLPPPRKRFPYYCGGRTLQMAQARCIMTSFVRKGVSLGGQDEVGESWIYLMFITQLMRLYELGHGATGEGGSQFSHFFDVKNARKGGQSCPVLDHLSFPNIESDSITVSASQDLRQGLWRSSKNGSESRTSAADENALRKVLTADILEAMDRNGPAPSKGWKGSNLSLSFLSSNSCNSTLLGSGVVDLLHPTGGLPFRYLKASSLSLAFSARAGSHAFIKAIRASFFATMLLDLGEESASPSSDSANKGSSTDSSGPKPAKAPFIVCVDEVIKKGTTYISFIRSLRNLAGISREPFLRGTIVDVGKTVRESSETQFTEQECFPNSFVRGCGGPYFRVGTHIETTTTDVSQASKGTHLQVFAEPVIPEKGISFGGPITIRVVENQGQTREFTRTLSTNGSRMDWGPIYLHAKPVASNKQLTAASGTMGESDTSKTAQTGKKKAGVGNDIAFNDQQLHVEGYQSIELARLTNRTPLLWLRVDPHGLFGGTAKIATFQQDACVAEQLFNDGDASGQIEALRTLAERPFRIQGSVKGVTSVYDARVTEVPVRVLGDCLRGSVALHSSQPHTPAIRAQAALAIAQWQNNKAPASKDAVGSDAWLGLDILLQYFRERFMNTNKKILPSRFTRNISWKRVGNVFTYSDLVKDDEDERDDFSDIGFEEDEEYRVRAAVVTAISSIRAKNGQTPEKVLKFLENELSDGMTISIDDYFDLQDGRSKNLTPDIGDVVRNQGFLNDSIVANSLLALCNINTRPPELDSSFVIPGQLDVGSRTGDISTHPAIPLIQIAYRWLQWGLYKERTALEDDSMAKSGLSISGASIASSAITSLYSLALLHQTTMSSNLDNNDESSAVLREITSISFYIDIFDEDKLTDITRAAAAQAITCICCAADRFLDKNKGPTGLLSALEFLLEKIKSSNSTCLQLTLADLMMDACTGRVCSTERVAIISGSNDLCVAGSRFYEGPLGGNQGGDNGSAVLMTVTPSFHPAATAVNDGARIGLRLLKVAGTLKEKEHSLDTVARVASFATDLWRTLNGDTNRTGEYGPCARNGSLRASLLSLWNWIWPTGCKAVREVQVWKDKGLNVSITNDHDVMTISMNERSIAINEILSINDLKRLVDNEMNRQKIRCDLSLKAYESARADAMADTSSAKQGLGVPLPLVVRDDSWRLGAWSVSSAHQRRAEGLDGGAAISRVRLKVSSGD